MGKARHRLTTPYASLGGHFVGRSPLLSILSLFRAPPLYGYGEERVAAILVDVRLCDDPKATLVPFIVNESGSFSLTPSTLFWGWCGGKSTAPPHHPLCFFRRSLCWSQPPPLHFEFVQGTSTLWLWRGGGRSYTRRRAPMRRPQGNSCPLRRKRIWLLLPPLHSLEASHTQPRSQNGEEGAAPIFLTTPTILWGW